MLLPACGEVGWGISPPRVRGGGVGWFRLTGMFALQMWQRGHPFGGRGSCRADFARLRSLYGWSRSFSGEASLRWLC